MNVEFGFIVIVFVLGIVFGFILHENVLHKRAVGCLYIIQHSDGSGDVALAFEKDVNPEYISYATFRVKATHK